MIQQSWMPVAWNEFGQREIPGSVHNDRVLLYHAQTSYKATTDEIAWCSSFACYVIEESGFKSTRSARARSWHKYGEAIAKPRYGCLVVMKRGKNPKQGHIGFFVNRVPYRKGYIFVLGGNQSNEVTIQAFPENKVLTNGYRWPTEVNW